MLCNKNLVPEYKKVAYDKNPILKMDKKKLGTSPKRYSNGQ